MDLGWLFMALGWLLVALRGLLATGRKQSGPGAALLYAAAHAAEAWGRAEAAGAGWAGPRRAQGGLSGWGGGSRCVQRG